MEVSNADIFSVFSNGGLIQYIMPPFQREYAWGESELDTLIEDACAVHDVMINDENSSNVLAIEHFLGSLVTVDSGNDALVPIRNLVDGQQRLTSLSLMLCALKQVALANHPDLCAHIDSLIVNAGRKGDLHYKVLPTTKYGDHAAYQSIVKGLDPPTSDSRIPVAYTYLLRELRHKYQSGSIEPETFCNVLTQNFQVVTISLKPFENPYKIFESLNAKGKPLTQADLVRNYIAMTLPAAMQEDVFCEHWAKIEELLQEKRSVGRSGIGELTAFIRHYLAMCEGVLCNEKNIYERFRDRMNRRFSDKKQFVDEIAALHVYAVLYDRLIRPERQPDDKIREAMQRLDVLDISTAYPFLMALSYAHHTQQVSTVELKKALNLLENYLMRRFLAEAPTNYLNKMFPTLWRDIEVQNLVSSLQGELTTRNYPSDTLIRQKLLNRPLYRGSMLRNQTVFILEQINRYLSEGSGGYTTIINTATVEHILPQSPGTAWEAELGLEYSRFQEFVHVIGNLTLVNQEWNSSLSNSAFDVKKAKLANHALLLNSQYFSQDISQWNEAAIQKRSEYLINKILEIWPNKTNLDDGQGPVFQPANFHPDMAKAVAGHLGATLVKKSKAIYSDLAANLRVICIVSAPRLNPEGDTVLVLLSPGAFRFAATNATGIRRVWLRFGGQNYSHAL